MIQIAVCKVLPVLAVAITPVLAIILRVPPVLLPVFSPGAQAIVQAAAAFVECLRATGNTILNPSALIGKT